MRKRVLSAFLLCAALLHGQTHKGLISWSEEGASPSFPKALYEEEGNTLPYFSGIFPWDRPGELPRIRLEVTESRVADRPLPSGFDASRLRETAPAVEAELVNQGGRAFVSLRFLPYFLDNAGRVRQVVRYDLVMEGEEALATLKKDLAAEWKDASVLASGSWHRVAVTGTGIHRIGYQELADLGLADPARVRIYGSGARLLPESFSEGHLDDLEEIPLHLEKGSDGTFGPGDYLLFWAQGPVQWRYDDDLDWFLATPHPYSWTGTYFLTSGSAPADAPAEAALSGETPTHTVTSFDHRDRVEDELYNLIQSGQEWYGTLFSVNTRETFSLPLPGKPAGEDIRLRVTVAASSNVVSQFNVRANGSLLGTVSIPATDLSSYTAAKAYEGTAAWSLATGEDQVSVDLEYTRPESTSQGWLNRILLQYRRELTLDGDELSFRDTRSAAPGAVSEFRVDGVSAGTLLWDVTDPSRPLNVPYALTGSQARFRLATDGIREFVAFRPGGEFPGVLFTGEGTGPVPNQNLHGMGGTDLVILCPDEFLEMAGELAGHRRDRDGLDVAVVTQQQVFNEFSSGTPDATAIRNFMKMFYDRAGGGDDRCRYLLLFGDGSFDNRNHTEHNPNRILTYQSANSLSPTQSYVSDDYFGLLDTDESLYSGLLDLGIGRLPASDTAEARELVDKLIGYDDPQTRSSWRNALCFIGDDEDANIHMRQADQLAEYVEEQYPVYNINKIYLDAYPQEQLAVGYRYPEVTRAINEQLSLGALIVNYTGHGGTQGLAHERILTATDINAWNNADRLPLFMTATCEFSRYDEYDPDTDQEATSAGEDVLLNPDGGGIGLFTTTRLVYSGPNHVLNEHFYEVVFEKDAQGQYRRLGDIIAYAKNNAGPGINKRNFTLLGDPSMRLAYPELRIRADSINGIPVGGPTDTLAAFDWVRVSGHLETAAGTLLEDFEGEVYPRVYDKEALVRTLANDDDPVWEFRLRNSLLYSGTVGVSGGRFSFGFYVPKDINYAIGAGKISFYGKSETADAQGYLDDVLVGGIGTGGTADSQHPTVELYMNDTLFRPGGITDPDPVLLVRVRDNYGINTTGNGIGHNLTAALDGDLGNAAVLNPFYRADLNSHNSGTIRYPYLDLEQGEHRIDVKIWDIHNNSTEAGIDFVVMESEKLLLEALFNYPNPFLDRTWFNVEHNRPGEEYILRIRIYSLGGGLVRTLESRGISPGYRLPPLEWDGRTAGGSPLGAGVYVYRAVLEDSRGEQAARSGKLVLSR
ncbi:MAG: type IX secretion system sortase PorU [Bacteroidales bacterium]